MKNFQTIDGFSEANFEIKRSKFISHAEHVESEDQAREILQSIKKKFFDARHNCSAWILDDQRQKFNDDGEPGGTAGKPILESIKEKKLIQVIVVVTRYFGGIKLGAGGLVRAYHHAATLALDSAKLLTVKSMLKLRVEIDYPMFNSVERFIRQQNFPIESVKYEANVSIEVLIPPDEKDRFIENLTEIASAKFKLEILDEVFHSE